jgi:hypothetical protein
LLAKGQNLKSSISPAAEEDSNSSKEGENALSHEMTVVTERQAGDGPRKAARLKSLIPLADPVLSTDTG